MKDWMNFLTRNGVKEGIKDGLFMKKHNLFAKESAISSWLRAECIEYDHCNTGCTIVWAPSGAGKTFTLCNLMAAESRLYCSNTKYVRIDWKDYAISPEGPSMLDWMKGQELAAWMSFRWACGFTVFLMDHFDTPMGHNRDQRTNAIDFIRVMLNLIRRGSPFAMIVCVNLVDNAVALRDMLNGITHPPCIRLLPWSVDDKQSMIWTSKEDARFFARSAWEQTQPCIKDTLLWEHNNSASGSEEESLSKLTQLVLCSGRVQETVRFLEAEDFETWDLLMVRSTESRRRWEEQLSQLHGSVDTTRLHP